MVFFSPLSNYVIHFFMAEVKAGYLLTKTYDLKKSRGGEKTQKVKKVEVRIPRLEKKNSSFPSSPSAFSSFSFSHKM